MSNAIRVICPYRYQGTWVFDDPDVDLQREPFVCGVPEMIDLLVSQIPRAEKGFRLLFAPRPFPGFQWHLRWVREEMGGHWYRAEKLAMEGWLCPALFKYFDEPPRDLHIKAEAIDRP